MCCVICVDDAFQWYFPALWMQRSSARKGPFGVWLSNLSNILKVAVIMVTLSENSNSANECSSTTPQINDREHFGSNIVSSSNERDFPTSQPTTAASAVNPHQNHHGLWDLNPELGYEIAASSGNPQHLIFVYSLSIKNN